MGEIVEHQESMPAEVIDFRQKIAAAEKKMLAIENGEPDPDFVPLGELPCNHYFSDGCYVRELFLPAGAIVTGQIHAYDCINIIPVGLIQVRTEEGIKVVRGPKTFTSPAGTKRLGMVFEDTIWMTVHRTDAENPESALDDLTVETYDQLDLEALICR